MEITIVCEYCKSDHTYEFKNGHKRKYCGASCRSKAWYHNNPETVIFKRQRYESLYYERKILSRIKHRCKTNGIPFDIDEHDIDIPKHCPILGIELNAHVMGKAKGYNPEAASVDRINPTKGYIKGNIRIISARANLLKNDATLEELRAVLADLEVLYADGVL